MILGLPWESDPIDDGGSRVDDDEEESPSSDEGGLEERGHATEESNRRMRRLDNTNPIAVMSFFMVLVWCAFCVVTTIGFLVHGILSY